jgi:uncharacterized protein YndB with AHSA1/START domain
MALVHNLKVEDSILINSYPEKVFSYLTESANLSKWWPKSAVSEPRKNGKLTFHWENNTSLDTEFKTFLAPRQVSFQFGKEFVELKLKEKRGETIVSVTHSNIVIDDSGFPLLIHIAQSWSFLLCNLKTVIEHNIDLR